MLKPDQTPVILLRLDNLVFSVAALALEELFIIKMVSDIQLLTLRSLIEPMDFDKLKFQIAYATPETVNFTSYF